MVVMFGAGWLVAKLRVGSTVDRASLSELERRFIDQMHGSALVGRFTIVGGEDRPAIVERYDMSSVEKVGGDHWRFNARIRYGSVDSRREDRDIVEVLPLV